MARKNKSFAKKARQGFELKQAAPKLQETPAKPVQEASKVRRASFIPKINALDFNKIAFGLNQENHSAPIEVPIGFTTEIPYESAINSTIIANPSPIPIRNFYSIMLSDPIVYSSMLYLITSIMSRIGDYNNPESPSTQKYVRNVIKRVGKRKLLQGLLTSLWAGFADVKLNWGVVDGVTTVVSIQILPPDSIQLAVTPDGQLDPQFGVLQYYFYINSAGAQQPLAYGPDGGNAPLAAYGSRMVPMRQLFYNIMYVTAIPQDHVIHHVFNPTGMNGNYYGVSMMQSIYKAITGKANAWEKLTIASSFKASPMVMFQTDMQATVEVAPGVFISVAENLENILATAASTGYMIIDGKNSVDHDIIDNSADLDKMLAPIYAYNDEIRAGLITPNLVGNSGSYANAMANTEANVDMINNITLHLIDTLETQFVKRLIDIGIDDEDKPEDYGYFELKDNSLNDKALWGKVLEMAKTLGVIDPTKLDDVNFIRKCLGMQQLTELSKDMMFNMQLALNEGMLRGINVNGMKQDMKTPYANGGVKEVKKDKYAGS